MGSFFKQRQKQHLQSLQKYLKYVFNDHLMLFLFFLLGGGMFVYSSFLKQDYHIGIYVSRLIILVIFSVVLLVGKVATLLVDADSVFLLPKQVQLKSYLQKAIQYSFILPFCLIIAVAFIVYPFNKVMNVYTQTSYIMIVISMLCLKYFDLIYQIQTSYFSKYKSYYRFFIYILVLVLFLANLTIASLFLSIGLTVILQIYFLKQKQLLNLSLLIANEKKRMQFIYRWINLFTDVPQVQMSVKRRAYLDWIMHVKVTRKNIYLPFYLSQIIRSNTYGSLIIRLSVLSIFLTILSHSHIISLYIASLFMFLLLLQLVPLYKEIDYILWPHIYPVSKMIRKQNLQKVLLMVGIFYILINSLCSIVYGVKTMGLMCLMLFAILMIFNFVYLPYHLSKKK